MSSDDCLIIESLKLNLLRIKAGYCIQFINIFKHVSSFKFIMRFFVEVRC